MNSTQRKLYSQAILDAISSLENDLSSITGQADNAKNDMNDPTKDDYMVREKTYELASQYSGTKNEMQIIEGSTFKSGKEYEVSLLNGGNINYGDYIYGRPYVTTKDSVGIYQNWFYRYGEANNRDKKFKSDKFYDSKDISPESDNTEFAPNLKPWEYIQQNENQGFIHELSAYIGSYNIITKGIPHSYRIGYTTVTDKPKSITIKEMPVGQERYNYYKYSFTGKKVSEGSWNSSVKNEYWTGTLPPYSIIALFTEDESKICFAEIEYCTATWETVTEYETYWTTVSNSMPSGGCPSGYSSTSQVSSQRPIYYKVYKIDMRFRIVSDVPYYVVNEPYNTIQWVNGIPTVVTLYKEVHKYYDFYPMKKISIGASYRRLFSEQIQKLIRERLLQLYRCCTDEGGIKKYNEFVKTYSIALNNSNYNTVWNNIPSVLSYIRYRNAQCHDVWSDRLIAEELNEVLEDRLDKSGGSLKQWYESAVSVDKMERDYYAKLKKKKGMFKKLLVQQPAEEFESGNQIIIDYNCSVYYSYSLGKYPQFNVGDTVYVRDEENNETMCTIIKKDLIEINDKAEVQYEEVKHSDGKVEQVAKTDNNGEPITIYTKKKAWQLTFNGNIPTIYDPDTMCIIKEL